MDGKAKKRLEVIKQKLQLLRQKLAGAKKQNDEPGERLACHGAIMANWSAWTDSSRRISKRASIVTGPA